VRGSSRSNVKSYLRVSLVICRLEMLENGKLVDKPESKGREIICSSLGSRDYKELTVWIKQELVTDKG
jgi:hypothetical protein